MKNTRILAAALAMTVAAAGLSACTNSQKDSETGAVDTATSVKVTAPATTAATEATESTKSTAATEAAEAGLETEENEIMLSDEATAETAVVTSEVVVN